MKNLSEKRVGLGFLCCLFRLFVCFFVVLVFSFKTHIYKIFMKTYCNFYFKVYFVY